jgi:hypothetical protein
LLVRRPHVADGDFEESVYLPIDCLANHPNVTNVELSLVCIGIAVALVLFCWSHNELYARVEADIRVGDESSPQAQEILALLDVGFSDAVCTFWNAEVYGLSLGVLVTTGLFPYIKVLIA